MSTRLTAPADAAVASVAPRVLRTTAIFAVALVVLFVLAVIHVTQGTADVNAADVLGLLGGSGDAEALRVLLASRGPRLAAGALVGGALGAAGAAFQSVARNSLASPDTLGVNAGAYCAVVVAAVIGLSLPPLAVGFVAFGGGVAAAALVMAVSAGGGSGPTRLVLAGSAAALASTSLTTLLLILNEQATLGLFAWGNGSLVQSDMVAVRQMTVVVLIAGAALCALGGRLDILGLGDESAQLLGLRVARTRVIVTALAVLLTAAAVTVAGPLGFVGLCAPAIVRLIAPLAPGLLRHRILVPLAGLSGMLVVIGSDVLLRAVAGGSGGVEVPTGTVTTACGAVLLMWLARRHQDSGVVRNPATQRTTVRSRLRVVAVLVVAFGILASATVLAMLAGDTWARTGDIAAWIQDRAAPGLTFVLDARAPRVAAAVLAGAAMALAGTIVQAVCRNPLAEPGLLGVTAGAGLGAVTVLSLAPGVAVAGMSAGAVAGALMTFAAVYAIAWRRGLNSDRLVLIGVATMHGCAAVTALIVIATDPWNTAKALTWLSGSTYGRVWSDVVPVACALCLAGPAVALAHRTLDLLALDDDTPRVLGVPLERARLAALSAAAVLTAAAVCATGVIGFVGLVAPHAARALVGSQHRRVVPVALLLGAALVSIADTVGRVAIAPAQIPAGLVTALIGTPYFLWLLIRSRQATS